MHQSALIAALLARAASARVTLALLALFALGVIAGYLYEPAGTVALAVPLALLAVNLCAAVSVRPVFRRQAPLLVVHLALLAVVVLVAAGKLTRLQGRLELTQGVPFDGVLLDQDAGRLHRPQLARAAFAHDGFTIEYAPGMKRGRTRNAVRWLDAAGAVQHAVIGDHEPLVLHGYRFYTTSNKGFAPLFGFQPHGSREVVQGTVHLPSYPAQQLRQARAWTLPDGVEVWVKLWSEEVLIDPARAGGFQMPRVQDVVVRVGETRRVLAAGQSFDLPGGRLFYAGLRTWMGYRVFHDWTLPWLCAASTLAALALGLHFWLRFRRQPWNTAPAVAEEPGRAHGPLAPALER